MHFKMSSAACTLAAALFAMTVHAAAQATVFSPESEQRAEALLKQMTIEEKVGQMNQSSGIVMPLLATEKPDNLIVQGKVGSILWLIDVKEINRLQHLAVEKSRLHIPILFAFDVIHGYRTVFPDAAGHGRLMGSGSRRSSATSRRRGRARRRHPVDLYPHGRHRARFALGPHR